MARIVQRKIGELSFDGGVIEIFETKVSNPKDLIKMKPKNSPLTNYEWVLNASIAGLAHEWNHHFQGYMREGRLSGRRPKLPTKKEDPSAYWKIYFGRVGEEAFMAHGSDREKKKLFLIGKNWPLEDLGEFGKWMKEAGIPAEYAPEIIREYMDD